MSNKRKKPRGPGFMARMQEKQRRRRESADQKLRAYQDQNDQLGLGHLNRPIEERTEDERRRDG